MSDDSRRDRETEGGEPLREWQRETWHGPFPVHENPFDEPEDAPELRELRSEELNNHSGEFWQTQTEGYQFGRNRAAEPSETPPPKKKEPGGKKRRLLTAAAIIGMLIAVWLILHYGVFVVREIIVEGNTQIPTSEIIRVSGIRKGMPILSLDNEAIEQRLEKNPEVVFRYLKKQLPGTVILAVKERQACCWMTWNGILYTMDKSRTVLSESEDLSLRPSMLVRVDGLKIRSGVMVGQTVVLETAEQQETFSALFLEMKVLGCTEMIEEADLSNLNSLLLTTRDGFTVAMGDNRNIHAKLRSMLLTREELIRRNYHGGVINVSLPETPVFSPAETQ